MVVLVGNTKILYSNQCKERLNIVKAIIMENKQPILNKIFFTTGKDIRSVYKIFNVRKNERIERMILMHSFYSISFCDT